MLIDAFDVYKSHSRLPVRHRGSTLTNGNQSMFSDRSDLLQ